MNIEPPEFTVVAVAVPPETTKAPFALTVVLSTVQPGDMQKLPNVFTVVLLAIPPLATTSVPPLTVVSFATPPEETLR